MSKKKELTGFEQDLAIPLMINNSKSSRGFYNLVVSKRDLGLYKIGLTPHRGWKFNDVKKYFGIKGNRETALIELEVLLARYKAGEFSDLEKKALGKS